MIREREQGVLDVLARGGSELAEPARLETARGERGAERFVAAAAEGAGAAGDVVGERDARAGRQHAVDHLARQLVPEHRAGAGLAARELLDVRSAEATREHADEHAVGRRGGHGQLAEIGRAVACDGHGQHGAQSSALSRSFRSIELPGATGEIGHDRAGGARELVG